MNQRLKAVRKAKEVNLTQKEFGGRLGVKDTAISKLENGENTITDQMILAICREFNVNEEWLRTGEGGEEAMFDENDNASIAAVVSDFNLDKMSEVILTAYVDMDSKKRAALNNFVRELSDRVMNESKEKARIGVKKIIDNSDATDAVKKDLSSKAAVVFMESFPYVGIGNVGEYNPTMEASAELDIDKEVESYRCELEAEKRAAEKLSVSPSAKEA